MKREVLLYALDCAPLADPGSFKKYYALQPEQRKQKTDAFRRRQDKILSLGAGVLLLRALPQGAAERVRCDENGKPYLPGEDIYFNLSHAGTFAVCAVSCAPVGCDVELIRAYLPAVARRFDPAEARLLEEEPDEARRAELFFRLWTLKESYMKAVGEGISLGLSSFCVAFEGERPVLCGMEAEWQFKEYAVASGYRCAVCAHAGLPFVSQPEFITID